MCASAAAGTAAQADELSELIDAAELVRPQEIGADIVTMYSKLRVADPATGQERAVTLCYPEDADAAQGMISVLSPLKLISSINEIQVGTHGLYIVKGSNAGLLLPQVASHYRWGREEFLQNTCAKAGLPENAWKDKETKIYVFSAQIFSE